MNHEELFNNYKQNSLIAEMDIRGLLYEDTLVLAFSLINNYGEAMAITETVFINANKLKANFRTFNDLKAYLLVSARNQAYDYLRSQEWDTEQQGHKE